ncbi:MAG: DUF3465 domain-containing protein [Candidatus Sericytochromatia bacterium]|nr:DUF3465 domain-containing protein [Candidatus Sericytochromatia bacterium]
MNRNPVTLLSLVASLTLAGCGYGPAVRAPRPQALGVPTSPTGVRLLTTAQAEAQIKGKGKGPLKANKDWVMLSGRVTKILPDDLVGNRHQHFLFEAGGETVKIAHNLELAPKVPVALGDTVEVKCEYIAASPYDVAHWTHYDPRGGEGGYIKHRGLVYDRN